VDPIEYIRAVRRRWVLVVLAVALACGVAWITTTVAPVGVGAPVRTYQATTVLLSTGGGVTSAVGNLKTLAALANIPEISKRVAGDIHYRGDPTALGARIQAVGDRETGLLRISATSNVPRTAKVMADKFAAELLGFLKERAETTVATESTTLTKALNELKKQIAALDARVTRASGTQADLLTAQRNAKVQIYGALSSRLQNISSSTDFTAGLVIIQDAVPEVIQTPAGFQPPRSKESRLVFAAILGLIAGVALSLVAERFDTRIKTKKAAEQHFGFPVLAEIPFIPKRKQRRLPVGAARRRKRARLIPPYHPEVANSFRLLGAGLSLGVRNGQKGAKNVVGADTSWGTEWKGEVGEDSPGRGFAILVTSPSPADGKTTVVAHLAFTFAQLGKKVIVLSCDLRRPHVHQIFGVQNKDGLVEALRSNDPGPILNGHIKVTPIERIRLVPSGLATENPAGLLSSERMKRAVAEACERADIVLLDTAPILASADITHLFPVVDAVLLVARVKKTTEELAQRASEVLTRLHAPVAGVALNAVNEVAIPSSYYRYKPVGRGKGGKHANNFSLGDQLRSVGDSRGVGDSPD